MPGSRSRSSQHLARGRIPALALLGLFLIVTAVPFRDSEASPSSAERRATSTGPRPLQSPTTAPVYGYQVIHVYPHDTSSYIEGLIYRNGYFYESSGLTGQSSLRKVDVQTGQVLKRHNMPASLFGEGVTQIADSLYQLTWQNHVGFTYVEGDSFQIIKQFTYPWEGWGLTDDQTRLIASDGTSTIRFLNPHTRQVLSQIQVTDGGTPVQWLNELEYIQNRIYANQWGYDRIAVIQPTTGQVEAWLDLGGLRDSVAYYPPSEVLNGIAYDYGTNHLFVTGKFWPKLFEIDVATLHPGGVGENGQVLAPEHRILFSNPNPSNGSTTLRFVLPSASSVRLTLLDVKGRTVHRIVNGRYGAGEHRVGLDVRNLPSGAYYVWIVAGGVRETERILVVR